LIFQLSLRHLVATLISALLGGGKTKYVS